MLYLRICFFFFFNDTATTEIYTLSLHDALPIYFTEWLSCEIRTPLVRELEHDSAFLFSGFRQKTVGSPLEITRRSVRCDLRDRSEEHTSELQSLAYLVCRLLLEKKKIQR